MSAIIADLLLSWYHQSSRPLPWRQNQDPYRIWISEVMLQQTTVAAVVPYYERFMARFPSIENLANAKESDVLAMWAGLGYYSRARNLHRASQLICERGFPQEYQELMELPGFGPYISRAVSSIAFNKPVGAVDGNLIRVLSRIFLLREKFWTSKGREAFQKKADVLMSHGSSSHLNQALMDLGSDICTKENPRCAFCPLSKHCSAKKANLQNQLPLKKPRKKTEIWHWQPLISVQNGKILLEQNENMPFLKNQWIFPGVGKKVAHKPKAYHFKHVITHHEIFVSIRKKTGPYAAKNTGATRWIKIKELPEISPFSILSKALNHKEL